MESDGAVKLVLDVYEEHNKMVYVKHFLGDDDATTRSQLTKQSENNKGKLPKDYPFAIDFWADVNHRVKVLVKPIFALDQLSNEVSICQKTDSLRIKHNFG